ncbi:TldD/PmbA family protein [Candidatus Bipolaricaulota bacterium]|nr:TldD/PmbA family protein [Candidatus Bipolaricaulota bacterium]HHR85066.1 TldD/PmbA family protein [Candidatus Acetothermia bacterium]
MLQLLQGISARASGWVELRYHVRRSKRISVRNGRLEESSTLRLAGVGVRALVDGVFGFASTTDLSERGISQAVSEAQGAARTSAGAKREKIASLPKVALACGEYSVQTDDPLDDHSLTEKLALVMRIDERVRSASKAIVSSSVAYSELQDEKVIVTTDGAAAHIIDAKPDFRVLAVAQQDGDQAMGMDSAGVSGGYADLFAERAPEEMADKAVRLAVDQLRAEYAAGEVATVILDPGLVGVLSHEAIGHTVEADLVRGGAITSGKIGTSVASDLVTLCDSGPSTFIPYAAGELLVDDEGVKTGRTVIIDHGILRSYLHSRESAAHFGVEPTGNARAFEYSDEPIIRMRNTYIEPGTSSVEEIIASVKRGYYLQGLGGGGQADSNAEFMFGVREAHEIVDGKIGKMVRGVTISGNAFEVLKSVDAVGNDFAWGLGAGHCGKGQLAKVDAGGPHLRCIVTIGGRQE